MKREIKTVKNIFKTGPSVKTNLVVKEDPPLFPEPTKDELDELKYLKQQTEIAEMEEKRDALLKHELKKNPSKRKKELLKVLNATEGVVDDYSVNDVDNFIEVPSDPSIDEAQRDPRVYYKSIKVKDDKRTYYYYFPIVPYTIPNTGTLGYKLDNYDVYLDNSGAILVDKSNPNTLPMLLYQVSKGVVTDPSLLLKLSKAGMYNTQTDVYDFAIRGKGFKVIKSSKENNVSDKAVESKDVEIKGFFLNPEDIQMSDDVEDLIKKKETYPGSYKLYSDFMRGKIDIIGLPDDIKLPGNKFRLEEVISTARTPVGGYVLLKKWEDDDDIYIYIVNSVDIFKKDKSVYEIVIPNNANKEKIIKIISENNKKIYDTYIVSSK